MTSERHIHTEGIGTWPRPDRVVDACFGDDFGIHAAVAGEYEHILHAEGESDIGLPASYAAECVAEVNVIKPEEGCILKSSFIEKTEGLTKAQFNRWRGYVRALEALDARLSGKELTREQERYMEKKRKG